MKRKDARGRPLDYERRQIHRQFDLVTALNGEGGSGARHRDGGLRSQLDRLVDTYESQGKTDVVLSVFTREDAQEIRSWAAYPSDPLSYRGHRVVILAEPEKR